MLREDRCLPLTKKIFRGAWNFNVNWEQDDIKFPRSVEFADVEKMCDPEEMLGPIFEGSFANMCRLDT